MIGSYAIYYHVGGDWADTFTIAENQTLYTSVNARIYENHIYVTMDSIDYILMLGKTAVCATDEVKSDGLYSLSALLS